MPISTTVHTASPGILDGFDLSMRLGQMRLAALSVDEEKQRKVFEQIVQVKMDPLTWELTLDIGQKKWAKYMPDRLAYAQIASCAFKKDPSLLTKSNPARFEALEKECFKEVFGITVEVSQNVQQSREEAEKKARLAEEQRRQQCAAKGGTLLANGKCLVQKPDSGGGSGGSGSGGSGGSGGGGGGGGGGGSRTSLDVPTVVMYAGGTAAAAAGVYILVQILKRLFAR